LLESVYEEALAWELKQTGLLVERQKLLPIRYKNVTLTSTLSIQ
jgi:GxxExxY protein